MKNNLRMIAAMLAVLMLLTGFPGEVIALAADGIEQQQEKITENTNKDVQGEKDEPAASEPVEEQADSYMPKEVGELLGRQDTENFTEEEWALIYPYLIDDSASEAVDAQVEAERLSRQDVYYRAQSPTYTITETDIHEICALKESYANLDDQDFDIIGKFLGIVTDAVEEGLKPLLRQDRSLFASIILLKDSLPKFLSLGELEAAYSVYTHRPERDLLIEDLEVLVEDINRAQEKASEAIISRSILPVQPAKMGQEDIKTLFLEGYRPREIRAAYMVSSITQKDIREVISSEAQKAPPSKALSRLQSAKGRDAELLDQMEQALPVNMNVVAQFMEEEHLTIEEYIQEIAQIAALMSGTPPEPIEEGGGVDKNVSAPFRLQDGNGTSVDINTGSLGYWYNLFALEGRNGLDVDLSLRYNTSESAHSKEGIRTEYYEYAVLNSLMVTHRCTDDYIIYDNGDIAYLYRNEWFSNNITFSNSSELWEYYRDYNGKTEYRGTYSVSTGTESKYISDYHGHTNVLTGNGQINPWKVFSETSSPAPSSIYYSSDDYSGSLSLSRTANSTESTDYVFDTANNTWWYRNVWYAYYSGTVTRPTYKMYIIFRDHEVLVNASYYYGEDPYDKLLTSYQQARYDLGAGWSFNLPSIEIDGSHKSLHLGNGGVYAINNDLSLKEYTLQDMKLEADNASFSNGQVSSAYVLKYKDGAAHYFASDGRVVGKKDRFGNTIKYQHIQRGSYYYLSKIIDTVGREITLTYTDVSNGVEIRIVGPDGSSQTLKKEGQDLTSVTGPVGTQTTFSYQTKTANYSLLSKSGGITNTYSLLSQIVYPTGAKSAYTYEATTRNLGEYGYTQAYRITNQTDYDGATPYNGRSYTYTGDYTGYPTYSNPQSLPESFSYSVSVVDSVGKTTAVTFNSKHLSISESIKDGTSPLYLKTQEYNANKLPVRVTQRSYNGSGSYMENVLLYEYDNKGNITASWDEQALGNNADTEHKTVYTYDTDYNIPLTSTHKTDASTTVLQQNTLTADGKAIRYAEAYENNVLKQKTEYLYDAFGNVTAERHYKDGFTDYIETTYSYTDNVTGRSVDLSGVYLTGKKVTGVLDAEGVPVDSSPGNPAGTLTQSYTYDIMGQVTSATDAAGNATTYQYDAMGRVLRITHSDGSHVGYEYDYVNNWMIVTNELGGRTKYDYDGFGNEVAVIDLDANQTLKTTVYDSSFRVLRENNHNSSADSAEISYTYDKLGRVTLKQTKNKAGVLLAQESYVYDNAAESGQYAKVTKTVKGDASAPDMVTVSYTDRSGRLIKQGRVESGNEYLDTFAYDYVGNKLEEKTAIAYAEYPAIPYTSKWEYDYAGRVLKQYNALGDFATFTYDALGQLISQTNFATSQQPYSASFEYDVQGRKLRDISPFEVSGGTIHYSEASYAYDQNGNLIRESTSTGLPGGAEQDRITEYIYNARNQLTNVTLYPETGAPESTGYTYDAMGNKLTMTVGAAITSYAYDVRGRLLSLTDPLGQSESYTYDVNGKLTSKSDRNGAVTVYVYDGLSRKLSETVTLDGVVTAQNLITYAITGQVKTEQNDSITFTRTYDALGRMATESETGGIVKAYAYNLADLRTSYTLTKSGSAGMDTTYTYDRLNRLSTVSENGTQAAAYTYDVNGNRATLTNGNGTSVEYAYNLANLVTSLTNKKGTQTLSAYTYTYYLDGNQATKTDHTGRTTSYTYDGAGRLTLEAERGAADAVSKAYTFDSQGNRATLTVSGAESYTTSYAYDLNNRLLTETKGEGAAQSITEYFYDPNGNTVAKNTAVLSDSADPESVTLTADGRGAELYSYDGFNRLLSVENDSGLHTYAYRPDGLRMSKTTGGVTVTHIWDGQNISVELSADGSIIDRYIRGAGLISSDANGYYLYNTHGDVVQLTSNTGTVTKEYHYDAFGNEKAPDVEDTNPFRYCGEYFDKETGTIYLRARYYVSSIGRFLSQDTHWNVNNMIFGDKPVKWNERQADLNDPLGLNSYTYVPSIAAIMQSGNLYVYCMNKPLSYVDPTGNLAWPGEIHRAVQNHIMYGDQYGAYNTLGSMNIVMGTEPSPSGRYLKGEVRMNYAVSTQVYMGTRSGRVDLVDINTGEFWEIKSNKSGTGLYQAMYDVRGYSIPGNTYRPKGLKDFTPTAGGEIPGATFVYKAAFFEYYTVTYYNPSPGVILYEYTRHTNYEEAAKMAAAILFAAILGITIELPTGYSTPTPVFP